MIPELIAIMAAWLMTLIAEFSDLTATKEFKRRIATLLIVISSAATMFSAWWIVEHNSRKQIVRPRDENKARYLQEASGGAMRDGQVLLVDDEVPAILRLEPNGDGGLDLMEHLWLHEEKDRRLDNKTVDDLEGLAVSPGGDFIYAVTSHALHKDEEKRTQRRYLLRTCIPKAGGKPIPGMVIVLDKVPLLDAFSSAIFDKGIADRATVPSRNNQGELEAPTQVDMEIEGLAADRAGDLYFGFRAPLSKKYKNALIARVSPEALFPDANPECQARDVPPLPIDPGRIEVLQMPLHDGGEDYGVVSMEFDATGEMVLLANSPNPFRYLPPMVCRWNPSARPSSRRCKILPETAESHWGKQEALILGPGRKAATIFIDGDKGLGGRITYDRSELGLPHMP